MNVAGRVTKRKAEVVAVTAVSDWELYNDVCRPGLKRAGVESRVTLEGEQSIAAAYEGARQILLGMGKVCLYIHQDAELLQMDGALDALAILRNRPTFILGSVGATEHGSLPWWKEPDLLVGRCNETGPGVIGAQLAHFVDGVVMMQHADTWPWAQFPGWHGYDAQRCLEAHDAGGVVAVVECLEVKHHGQDKWRGREYHMEHIRACHEIAAEWGLECEFGASRDAMESPVLSKKWEGVMDRWREDR